MGHPASFKALMHRYPSRPPVSPSARPLWALAVRKNASQQACVAASGRPRPLRHRLAQQSS
ncbi:hypothetical protein BFW01_g9195 [Lasiodiplodia theobromae]|nr:hypothetical protein BFW01_g9195 [Lasiodiplodia theobromae]